LELNTQPGGLSPINHLNAILERSPGFCLHFSLSSTGNSNPAYPKQLESITPAINDTSFLLSCPVTGRTQNSPLAISDPISNSEKSLLRPLVEAFLVSQRLWISQSPEWREPKTKHFAKEPLAEIARGCTPTSTSL